MVDDVFGELFLEDTDDDVADAPIAPPVIVPVQAAAVPRDDSVAAGTAAPSAAVPPSPAAAPPVPSDEASSNPAPADLPAQSLMVANNASGVPEPAPVAPEVARPGREERLADALNLLMEESREIEAAALVSLDGFTMAAALPEGMQEDRVGAMSAAILGLGERAAAELGRGKLSQVFIEGDEGYVLLMAAGERSVLTCLAGRNAKLGLVIFDMRTAAESIGSILG